MAATMRAATMRPTVAPVLLDDPPDLDESEVAVGAGAATGVVPTATGGPTGGRLGAGATVGAGPGAVVIATGADVGIEASVVVASEVSDVGSGFSGSG